MNTRIFSGLMAAGVVTLLSGCSTESVVTLQDGTQYITEDMPKTKTADGFYEFTDVSGKKVKIRADDVATVQPED